MKKEKVSAPIIYVSNYLVVIIVLIFEDEEGEDGPVYEDEPDHLIKGIQISGLSKVESDLISRCGLF